MNGVVDVLACPTRSRKYRNCRCEICALCGYRKHMAIHGGTCADPSKLFGHAFQPRDEQPCIAYARYCAVNTSASVPTQERREA